MTDESAEATADATSADAAAAPGTGDAGSATDTPALRPDVPRRVRGRVSDLADGAPLAGVRVLYVIDVGGGLSWFGGTTGDDGAFDVAIDEASVARGRSFEVRFGKAGYRTTIFPAAAGELTVQLATDDAPRRTGRIVGALRAAAGETAPVSGVYEFDAYTEMADNRSFRAWVDERGEFVLDGLAAGRWLLDHAGADGDRAEVRVVEDTETRVAVAGARRIDDTTRTVLVRGLPREPGLFVRAELTPRRFWRVPVVDGVARFPHLGLGAWRLVLQTPQGPGHALETRIEAGEGDVVVAWPAD